VRARARQSRSCSLTEAAANVAAGFVLAVLAQQVIFPGFGITVTLIEHAGIAAIFTFLSLARSYTIRRVFERVLLGRASGGFASRRGARVAERS
jgi:hypothetical protein